MESTIAIIGASGVVGQALIGLLKREGYWGRRLRLFASERSLGGVCPVTGYAYEILTQDAICGVGLAFLAVDAAISRLWVPRLREAGAVVIDKSPAFRMRPEVPLVVPEINGHLLNPSTRLVASPNCSAIIACMALAPLHKAFGLKDVMIATYQAASGAGAQGLAELEGQCHAWAKGEIMQASTFPHPLAFNLIPEIGSFEASGEAGEEVKLREESQKILNLPDLTCAATCVRVPTLRSHALAMTATFEKVVDLRKAKSVLSAFPGLLVMDDPVTHLYPTPLSATEQYACQVGRLRLAPGHPKRLSLFVAGDQLLKGASLNAFQIAKGLGENE